MNGAPRHFFEFGAFRIDVEERRLLRDDTPVALASRAFDVLLELVRNAGRTVDKNELIRSVWADTFVEEGNLNHHVSTLRKALGDDLKEQRFIKTLPKRGYQFTADVHEIVESDEEIAVQTISRGRVVIKEETTQTFWTVTRTVIAGGLAAVLLLAGGWAFLYSGKSSAKTRWTTNREAAEAYTTGRELWKTRSSRDLYEATRLLETAVQADPEFALAHAALADAYAFDYYNWTKAVDEANKAITIDPNAGEPHASIGFVKMFWENDLRAAEQELEIAVNLSPEYATGRQWYALNLAALGRRDAALVEIEMAEHLEPSSTAIMADHCQILYFDERYADAAGQCWKLLDADAGSARAHELLYQIYCSSGRYDEAVSEFMAAQSLVKNDRLQMLAERASTAYHEKGIAGFRRAVIEFYTATGSSYKLARELAQSGARDAAIAQLTKAADTHDLDLTFLTTDPAFTGLANDPARHALVARLIH